MTALVASASGCRRSSAASANPGAPGVERGAANAIAAVLKAPGEAQVGDKTSCAMHSDAVFTVAASTPKVEYRGRTYYFCCPECAKHFAEHPGDFVK
jgi:YHS domain-containing protein